MLAARDKLMNAGPSERKTQTQKTELDVLPGLIKVSSIYSSCESNDRPSHFIAYFAILTCMTCVGGGR